MHDFRLKYIPSELPMENLVALDMSYSNLEQLWKKPVILGSLKILTLSHCIKLVRVGGFSGLPSLERLILNGCISLNYLCESIGYECADLEVLDMSDCNKLRKLPRSLGKLKKVRILSVSGYFGVDEFPVELKDMESLKEIKAESIPKLVLHSLPLSLVILSLKGNNLSNESFPMDFSSMSMLKELYLDENPIDSLPTFVRSLCKLKVLSFKDCSMLKSVLYPPSTMESLYIEKCLSLMKITFHEEMSLLPMVVYSGAESLKEIPGLVKIQDLAQVDEKILSALGWTNLKCLKDQTLNIKVPNMNICDDPKKLPVQMLCAFGIFSTGFLGKEVPDWLGGQQSSNGSSMLSYMMPSTPVNKRFQGFNIAFVHAFIRKGFLLTYIKNETKNLSWTYDNSVSVTGEVDESIVRLSHWMFGNNEFEDGDEVTLHIHFLMNEDGNTMLKKCAISPVYGDISDMDGEEDPLAYYKSWKFIIGGNLSQFQNRRGHYFLFERQMSIPMKMIKLF